MKWKPKNIDEININFSKFQFNWDEEWSYGAEFLKKGRYEIISFRITEESCYLLLKGRIKFFGFRFMIKEKRKSRVEESKLKMFLDNEGFVLDDEKYNKFKKELILTELK